MSIDYTHFYFLVLSFGAKRKDERKGTPEQFGRIAELDALYVRPKGEGQGCPESNSLRFTPLRQTTLSPRIFLHSLTGFKGDGKRSLLTVLIVSDSM